VTDVDKVQITYACMHENKQNGKKSDRSGKAPTKTRKKNKRKQEVKYKTGTDGRNATFTFTTKGKSLSNNSRKHGNRNCKQILSNNSRLVGGSISYRR